MGLIVILVIGFISFVSPIGGIIGTLLGVILVTEFGLIPMSPLTVMGLVFVAILSIILMRRRYG